MNRPGGQGPAKEPGINALIRSSIERERVEGVVDQYVALHRSTADRRRIEYADLVNGYYDLVTDFFEYGWGPCFHFAPGFRGETFRESIVRYEHYLALRLGLASGMCVLDVGCGVGGPMRNIARFADCHVTGINNNAYQVGRAEAINAAAGLAATCRVIHGDFMSVPLPDASVDAAYSIEATVHAPSWTGVFREIRRVLKPGGCFALYDWCVTAAFDGQNVRHLEIKHAIEQGTGLAELRSIEQFLAELRAAGFELLDHHDHAQGAEIPWFEPLAPSNFSFAGFRSSRTGRKLTNAMVRLLELAHVAPKGAAAVGRFLDEGASALVAAGRLGIFTPMYFALARNPTERADGADGTAQTRPMVARRSWR